MEQDLVAFDRVARLVVNGRRPLHTQDLGLALQVRPLLTQVTDMTPGEQLLALVWCQTVQGHAQDILVLTTQHQQLQGLGTVLFLLAATTPEQGPGSGAGTGPDQQPRIERTPPNLLELNQCTLRQARGFRQLIECHTLFQGLNQHLPGFEPGLNPAGDKLRNPFSVLYSQVVFSHNLSFQKSSESRQSKNPRGGFRTRSPSSVTGIRSY